jgi:hypothetical protein
MGITIHYTLKSAAQDGCEAREIIESLHEAAQTMPFEGVSDVVEMSGEECGSGVDDAYKLMRFQASITDDWDFEQPQRIIGFRAKVGGGCEDMNIGLARHSESDIWMFNGWCKTQDALDSSRGGLQNFLRCNEVVIGLLDKADQLGVVEFVRDDGGYREHRKSDSLAQSVSKMNELIARARNEIEAGANA